MASERVKPDAAALLLVAAVTAAGFALTMLAAYPGYMTNDATYVHSYIEAGAWGIGSRP